MFLEAGTTYEARLTLTDPDGGSTTRMVTATTRTPPVPDPAGRRLFAVPGGGGGSGTSSDPFRGLQAAADVAQPGDTIHVAAGSYGPFELTRSGSAGHPIRSSARRTGARSSMVAEPIEASSRWGDTTRRCAT